MEIVRDYDVRGIYPKELNEKKAYEIGLKIGSYAKDKIFLNYDNRIGSLRIRDSLEKGIIDGGGEVIEGPLGPLAAIALQSYIKKSIGLSITASHNPAEYTGIISYYKGITLQPKEYIKSKVKHRKAKSINYEDFNEEYREFLVSKFPKTKLKIVFDSLGGASTIIGTKILEEIAKVYALREKFDNNYYGYTPEPSEKTSRELAREVIKENADFGLQVDCDADRALIIDDKGNLINLARIEILFNKVFKVKDLITTVSAPNILERYFRVKYTPVGRPYVERNMKKGVFGFEGSGHLYFGDYYPFSDGILVGLMVAKMLHKTGKKLSELLKSIPNVFYFEDKIKISSLDEAINKLEKIKEELKAFGKLNTLDGVRVDMNGSFILFRKSNTEPIIRYYVSATSEDKFERAMNIANKMASRL